MLSKIEALRLHNNSVTSSREENVLHWKKCKFSINGLIRNDSRYNKNGTVRIIFAGPKTLACLSPGTNMHNVKNAEVVPDTMACHLQSMQNIVYSFLYMRFGKM